MKVKKVKTTAGEENIVTFLKIYFPDILDPFIDVVPGLVSHGIFQTLKINSFYSMEAEGKRG